MDASEGLLFSGRGGRLLRGRFNLSGRWRVIECRVRHPVDSPTKSGKEARDNREGTANALPHPRGPRRACP